jgi:hypothetical protein
MWLHFHLSWLQNQILPLKDTLNPFIVQNKKVCIQNVAPNNTLDPEARVLYVHAQRLYNMSARNCHLLT